MGWTPPPINRLPAPGEPAREVLIRRKSDGVVYRGMLPNITDIESPGCTTKSATIRWYHDVGYTPSEIYNYLGVKYQMVRNIVVSPPKRAAREDTPELVVVLRDEGDLFEAMMDGALDASLKSGRKERLAAEKADRRELKRGPVEDPDEDTEDGE